MKCGRGPLIARKNNTQITGGDVIGDLPGRSADETQSGARGRHQRVEIVRVDSRNNACGPAPGRRLTMPFWSTSPVGENETVVIFQIVRIARLTTTCQVGWRCTYDQPNTTELARDQARIVQTTEPKRQIHALLSEVDDAICQHEVEAEPRIFAQKQRQQRGEFESTEERWRAHAQLSGWHVLSGR